MSELNSLPTAAEARAFTLAKLRYERMQHQLVVAHYDFVGIGVETGFIPHEVAERMLAEAFGPAGEGAE